MVGSDVRIHAAFQAVGCAVDAFHVGAGAADLEAAQRECFFGQIGCRREVCREQQGDEEQEASECFCFHEKDLLLSIYRIRVDEKLRSVRALDG